MKKKIALILILCVFVLNGCTNVNKAQKEFDQGNYEKVVEMLANNTDEKAKSLYDVASVKILNAKIDDALNNSDADMLAENIKKFTEVYNGGYVEEAEKDDIISKHEKLLRQSTNYDDFKMIDMAIAELKKMGVTDDILASIEKVSVKYGVNKLKAALTGTWTRCDNTFLNGSKIDVIFSENSGKGIMKYASPGAVEFVNGDIKWKDIEVYNANNFSYNDLFKGQDGSRYIPANATIDYETMTLSVHVTGTYSNGAEQSWIKDSDITVVGSN